MLTLLKKLHRGTFWFQGEPEVVLVREKMAPRVRAFAEQGAYISAVTEVWDEELSLEERGLLLDLAQEKSEESLFEMTDREKLSKMSFTKLTYYFFPVALSITNLVLEACD